MSDTRHLRPLPEHCAAVGRVLAALWQNDPVTVVRDGEALEFGNAAEWLDIAAGVCNVEVVTGRFDESVLYCKPAQEYEDARSSVISKVATELTVFTFVWGAFETVVKIIEPPSIPRAMRANGADGLVDRAIYFIKDTVPFPAYQAVIKDLRALSGNAPPASPPVRSPHMGTSGVGLDFVRRIRNRFAHGTLRFEEPDGSGEMWSGETTTQPQFIALSTRLVLFTVQMLLIRYYQGQAFGLDELLPDEDDYAQDIHTLLQQLHHAGR